MREEDLKRVLEESEALSVLARPGADILPNAGRAIFRGRLPDGYAGGFPACVFTLSGAAASSAPAREAGRAEMTVYSCDSCTDAFPIASALGAELGARAFMGERAFVLKQRSVRYVPVSASVRGQRLVCACLTMDAYEYEPCGTLAGALLTLGGCGTLPQIGGGTAIIRRLTRAGTDGFSCAFEAELLFPCGCPDLDAVAQRLRAGESNLIIDSVTVLPAADGVLHGQITLRGRLFTLTCDGFAGTLRQIRVRDEDVAQASSLAQRT